MLSSSARILFFIMLILPVTGLGQGIVQIQNYSPDDYGNFRQNWAVTQTDTGTLFFGNGGGLLHYGGYKWSFKHVPAGGQVRSFGTYKGQIHWGGNGDFGFIKADSLNRIYPVSLREHTDSTFHNFSRVWQILELDDKLYHRVFEGIYIYERDTVFVEPTDASLRSIFSFRDRLVTQISNIGLSFYDDGEFTKIAGSELYDGDVDVIFTTVPLQDDLLLISRKNGFMRFDGEQFLPFETDAAEYVNNHQVYRAVPIGQNRVAIATLSGGIVIMDLSGKMEQIITEDHGLPTNIIYDLFQDSEETLWAATDNGIVKLLVNNPVTVWGEQAGYSGATLFIEKVGNAIYAGTTEGLFMINPEGELSKSELVTTRVYDGIETGNGHLISSADGLFTIDEEGIREVSSQAYLQLARGVNKPDYFYGVFRNRIDRLQLRNGEPDIETFLQLDVNVRHLYADEQNVWIAGWDNTVYQYSLDGVERNRYEIDVSESARLRKIGKLDGKMRLATSEGLFLFDTLNNQFEPDTTFNDPEIHTTDLFNFEQCNENEIWFRNNRLIKRAIRDGGEWRTVTDPYRTIARNQSVETIRCNSDGTVWFGGSRSLYHLSDPGWSYEHDFNTNITGVFADRDSLLYGGFGEQNRTPVLRYEENNLRFTYAAASYINPRANSYRTRLRGYEDDWSEWSSETQKDYTFIPEGTYTFEVQGRNLYHTEGTIAAYTFRVLPPWYRTIWAYLFYLVLAGGIIYGGFRIRLNTILQEQRIRDGIARDLHDELSSTLSSINFFAEAIDSKKLDKKDTFRFLSLIQRSSREAKEKISDIVWVIHSDHDDWESLLLRCKRFAADLLDSRDIKHIFENRGTFSGKPSINERKNIWLIFREILTNIARHAEAEHVKIHFNLESGRLLIFIEDDGKGFNPEEVDKDANGVQNIKERANQMKGTASLQTKKGEGTRWEIEVRVG